MTVGRGLGASLTAKERKELKRNIDRWATDPVLFVLEVFAPGYDERHAGDPFQLERWHLQGLNALVPGKHTGPGQWQPRIAAKASKGVGKTAFLSWVGWWFLLCFPHVRAAAASITLDNLLANLWPELALWQGYSPLLSILFRHNGRSIESVDHPKTWFLDARSFEKDADAAKQNESMAGLHSENVLILLDEAGSMPNGVVDAAKGIFTDRTANALLVLCGNCNDEDGPLGVISRDEPDRWTMLEINGDPDNPDRCTRVSIEEARAEIAKNGRDDDVVRVNYLGLFPLRGSNKLLGSDEVSLAMQRDTAEKNWIDAPVIFGLDAALDGDDTNVLFKRQGAMSWHRKEWEWRKIKPGALAERIGLILDKHEGYGAVFVDVTGGWGQGVTLRLDDLGYPNIIAVDFGAEALNPAYHNRRAEMHFLMAEWVQTVGCLPNDAQLRIELCAPIKKLGQKGGHSTRMIEPKKDIKARIGRSPDKSDALALTFAAPVFKRSAAAISHRQQVDEQKFKANPYAFMSGKR